MNLTKLLELIPEDRIIYLTAGSGYFFGGTKGSLSEVVDAFDAQFARRYDTEQERLKARIKEWEDSRDKISEILDDQVRIRKAQEKKEKQIIRFQKQLEDLKEPKPLYDRDVIETFERISEDALAIVVEGAEPGKIWTIIQEPRRVAVTDDQAAQALAAAILKVMAEDYAYALQMPSDDARRRSRVSATYKTLTSPWAQTLAMGLDVEAIADMVRRNPNLKGG